MPAFLAPCPRATKFYAPHTKLTPLRTRCRRQPVKRYVATRQFIKAVTAPSSTPVTPSSDCSDIKLMACDMDGTLLTTDKNISEKNVSTIIQLMEETDVIFIPATGKSRAGAIKSMGPVLQQKFEELYPAGSPGVYLQGLLVFDLKGQILYEATLSTDLALKCVTMMEELKLDLIAYSRDSILCEKETEFTRLLPVYHEPDPISIGSWTKTIEEGSYPVNKMIYMAEPERIDEIRPLVEREIGDVSTITQAQSNMLEVLPLNNSKGDGVYRLLTHLNIDPQSCLAIGDAENDIELLKMVGYSCAVQNALPAVKTVAKYTDFPSNDQDGVSSAILRFLLPTVQ